MNVAGLNPLSNVLSLRIFSCFLQVALFKLYSRIKRNIKIDLNQNIEITWLILLSMRLSNRHNPFTFFILCGFIFILAVQAFNLIREITRLHKVKKMVPHQRVGQNFYGLNRIFENVEYVGYYTDKDLDEPSNNKRFSEAQYVVAPTVLDINNTDHHYVLFDCAREANALEVIQKLDLHIMQKHLGLILTRQKQ